VIQRVQREGTGRAGRWSIAVVVGLYLAAAVLYGVAVPIFETPDENGHYAYIHELTEGRGLPVQGTPSGERVTGYVASHPPLYYALCAALTFWVEDDVDFWDWAWRNPYHANGFPGSVGNKNFLIHTGAESFPWRGTPLTVHLARLVSALLGAVAVVGTYGTALELTGGERGRPFVAVGAAVLTAFNPMFVFTGARVSNDAAVAAFGSLVIWGATRLAVRGLSRRGLVLLGAALGLAALSKLSGLTLAPAVALALFARVVFDVRRSTFDVRRATSNIERRTSNLEPRTSNVEPRTPHTTHLPRLLTDALILFGTAALVCGWWFVRNLSLYGELMGVNAWLSHTGTVRPEPIGLLQVIPQLEGLEMSYWAMFGWFNIPVAPWMYRAWWVLVRLAAVGLLLLLAEQWTHRRLPRRVQAGLAVVALSFLLLFGSVWRFIMIVLGAQGRYLFPAIGAASTLLMVGLARLAGRNLTAHLTALLAVAHLAATLAALFLFIIPAYTPPQPVTGADLPEEMTRFEVNVAGTPIRLIGGLIEVDQVHPGDRVPVSLYWRAEAPPETDYVVHVRLLGRDWERIGGTDGYPGGGTFPTTLWEPGVVYRDRYLLPVAEDAEGPVLMGLEAGMRVQGGDPLTFTLSSGVPWPGPLLLDTVPLRPTHPPSAQVAYPIGARLGGSITLVGADLSSARVMAGDTVTVTLVWQAEAEVAHDYTVFVHLMDAGGQPAAQADAPPLDGAYPTSWWLPGDVVRDPHRLAIPADLAPGVYTLLVGMYEPTASLRVTATDAEGNRFADDIIPVATLEVR